MYYQGKLSPDFYAWIFPHGKHASIGTGSMHKGFSLRTAVGDLRKTTGLDAMETVRKEGAPIPLKPLSAGTMAATWSSQATRRAWSRRPRAKAFITPCIAAASSPSGVQGAKTGDAKALAEARQRFLKAHGKVFWVLGILQHFWYRNDGRRERFV